MGFALNSNQFDISEPVRGCWPANLPLPLVSPTPSLVSPVCEFQETEHVSACLCDSPRCNAPTSPHQLQRQPKQIIFPTEAAPMRQGRQGSSSGRLKCYSCGSLFDRSKPQCDEVMLELFMMIIITNNFLLFSLTQMTTAK